MQAGRAFGFPQAVKGGIVESVDNLFGVQNLQIQAFTFLQALDFFVKICDNITSSGFFRKGRNLP